jgi:sterol desaturase/sphingolipid hydroxylase (fatty acid hydroxylase superfamily)
MVLLGRHPLEMWIWLGYRLYSTYEAHSNLYLGHTWLAKIGLTVSEDAAFHSFHHEQSHRGNFSYPHWDILFGTMDHWLAEGGTEGYVAKRLGKGHLD